MNRSQGVRDGGAAPLIRPLVVTGAVALSLALLAPLAPAGATELDHRAQVVLLPAEHRISVEDEMAIPAGLEEVRFALHAGLAPEVRTEGVSLEALAGPPTAELLFGPDAAQASWFPPGAPEVTVYALRTESGSLPETVTLAYGGLIHHPLEPAGEEYDRSFSETVGTIQEDGVFLSGSTFWLPQLGSGAGSGRAPGLVRFALDVDLPDGWHAVSEGRLLETAETAETGSETGAESTRARWLQETPVEDAHLIAAPFSVFEGRAGDVATYAYLRQPDEALAGRYLATGAQYLAMYEDLIGPYPYPKMALVENFWETGYGMPSFTLLGPTVIRFPFILHSSWPHEILHNWWGNGVFPPAGWGEGGGNWSEGLTAYLADHLSKERSGQGADYRRDLLQKYADYVREGNDFPLTEFRSRHSGATAAVGYGKTAMVFHMLRRRLGDAAFIEGLRSFYRDHRGERAGFDDLRQAFEAAHAESLGAASDSVPLATFFEAWVEHPGAPVLELTAATAEETESGWQLEVGVAQTQEGMTFPLRVPVAVTVEGQATAQIVEIDLDGARAEQTFDLPGRPLRLAVDPAFDLFRRLDPREVPPAIGSLFGAEKVTLVLPAGAPAELAAAYRNLAAAWGASGAGEVAAVSDAELDALPADRAVWVIGWENRFRPRVAAGVGALGEELGEGALTIGEETFDGAERSVVAAVRVPGDPDRPIGFVAADRPAAVPGLARKLPHYGKYGYLAFTGDGPDNVAKGSWQPVGSPLERVLATEMTPPPPAAPLPERSPLAELPPPPSGE